MVSGKLKLSLRLVRNMKSNSNFHYCINSKRLNRENRGLLLNGVDDLVIADILIRTRYLLHKFQEVCA